MIPTTATVPDALDKHDATNISDEYVLFEHVLPKLLDVEPDDPFLDWLKANGYDSVPKFLTIHPEDFRSAKFHEWIDSGTGIKHSLPAMGYDTDLNLMQRFSTYKYKGGHDVTSNFFG